MVDRQRDGAQENEIRGKRNGQAKKPKDTAARRYRAERRRRRKNRERKRGRKRARNGEKSGEARRASKLKRRMNDAPAALLLGKIDGHVVDDTTNVTWRGNQTRPSGTDVTSPSNLQDQLTTEATKRSPQTTSRYNMYEDTVEREFSKQLEKEISRTQMEDPASLENRILGSSVPKSSRRNSGRKEEEEEGERGGKGNEAKFGNSRYDAEKMLGYSRTEEDLPILDLENEVLARTLKDYNAYMTSSLRLSMVARRDEVERRRAGGGSHFHGKPIIDEAELDRLGGKKGTEWASSTAAYEDDTKGDLSCINGTFVPAPLARHALIKYVK